MVKNRKDKKRRECTNFVGRGEGSVYKKKSFKLAETYKIIYIYIYIYYTRMNF